MSVKEDPRLIEAKAIPMSEMVDRLGIAGLRRNGWELSGPCPVCGSSGHDPRSGPVDRFNINLRSNQWLCRKCPASGGDQISLVRFVENCSFLEALTTLCGASPRDETPEQRCAREKRQREARQKVERQAEQQRKQAQWFKRQAFKDAKAIWLRSLVDNGAVAAYLRQRGITDSVIQKVIGGLRYAPNLPYFEGFGRDAIKVHEGPAMIARMVGKDGRGQGVHRTWLDAAQPKGKVIICHEGTQLQSKKTRGSTKGAAIHLHTPLGAETLVMGEGIETTLTALVADPYPNAAYWAGVDLGNMAGRMQKVKGTRYSGLPDMSDDDAFIPPPWVQRLVFIMDGDSDPKMTRAKLESGLKRAMAVRPGLQGRIVHAGQGVDLNDVLVGAT